MLSDIIQPRLVELGKIKIGKKEDKVRKSQTGVEWRAPEKIDHFLLTTLNRDGAGNLTLDAALLAQLAEDGYADKRDGKIRRLPIRVLSNDPEDILQASWCWYGGRHIGARGDGKTVTWFVDRKTKKWLDEPVVEEWTEDHEQMADAKGNKIFKQHGIFNCVIASKGSRFGGVHKFRTTSKITISQLYGGLLHIMTLTGGVLVGLPLQLCVRPLPVAPTVNGQTVSSTVFVVHVELVGADLQAIQDQAMKQAEFMLKHQRNTVEMLNQYRALLRAPGHETSVAEVADITEEFHPDQLENREPVPMPRAVDEQPAPTTEEIIADPLPPEPEPIQVEKPADPPPQEALITKEEADFLRDAIKKAKIKGKLFTDHFQIGWVHDLPAARLTEAKEWIDKTWEASQPTPA